MGILWVVLVCGARLYSGVSSPADVQGGMLVGGVLVRIWLPVCEDVNALLVGNAFFFGVPRGVALSVFSCCIMLLHPFTPGDRRSWTALIYSTKAVSFGNAFILGANQCSELDWCVQTVPSLPSLPPTSLGSAWELLYAIAHLLMRNAFGFAMLALAAAAVSGVSAYGERSLRAALPDGSASQTCAPRMLRNAAMFTSTGFMVSLGVPVLLKYVGW